MGAPVAFESMPRAPASLTLDMFGIGLVPTKPVLVKGCQRMNRPVSVEENTYTR